VRLVEWDSAYSNKMCLVKWAFFMRGAIYQVIGNSFNSEHVLLKKKDGKNGLAQTAFN